MTSSIVFKPMTQYGEGLGNCLDACVASLLGKEISDLPYLSDAGKGWMRYLSNYCKGIGVTCIWVAEEHLGHFLLYKDTLCICVLECESEDHAVVGEYKITGKNEDGSLIFQVFEVFDPNERNTFPVKRIRGVIFLFKDL